MSGVAVQAVISDFGGVLSSPMFDAFKAFQADLGVGEDALARALGQATQEDGENPIYALERGEVSEGEFIARMERSLAEVVGREVQLHAFGERYFAFLSPNQPLLDYYRELRARGLRLALLTNNVREWEPHWRAMLPMDEFELVVDSAFVGMRKPDPAIYALTLERLGLAAEACAFVDDVEANVQAALALGLRAVHFRDTEQAVGELEALLA